mgnify:CR=1 FL=1
MTRFTVSESAHLYVGADRVWALIGGFSAIADWHPEVQRCAETSHGTQAVRRLDLAGERRLVERLEDNDPARRRYTYTVVESDLPLRNATGLLRVAGESRRTATVIWELQASPDGVTRQEAVTAVQAFLRAGLEGLRFRLGA